MKFAAVAFSASLAALGVLLFVADRAETRSYHDFVAAYRKAWH